MRVQDEMRLWIRSKLKGQGRGSQKQLADFLGLRPNQISRMLNTEEGKETRSIKADEWLRIEKFFSPEKPLKKIEKPVRLERARLIKIYDSSSPERQKMLLEFAEFLARQPKKQ